MGDEHLSADVLFRWLEGEDLEEDLLEVIIAKSREALAQAEGEGLPAPGDDRELQPRGLVGRALEQLRALVKDSKKDSAQGLEKLADELLAQPESGWRTAVQERPRRYGLPGLAMNLLDRSKAIAPVDPARSESFAFLAEAVARAVESTHRAPSALAEDLQALAIARRANARRLAGAYHEAESLFMAARGHLDLGSGDPIARADIDSLHGSLLRDQRRLPEACRVIRRAARLYRVFSADHEAGRCLMKQAAVLDESGDPQAASGTLRRAIELLDFEKEPRLESMVFGDLAFYVAAAGDPDQGLEIFRRYAPEKSADRRARLRASWKHGLILAMAGRLSEAVVALTVAHAGFAELEEAHNLALVSLDLAQMYAQEGHLEQVKILAAHSLTLLQWLDVPRDALASFLLFAQAAEVERASQHLLRQVKQSLSDPRSWRTSESPN